MPSARPIATATMRTSSTSPPRHVVGFGIRPCLPRNPRPRRRRHRTQPRSRIVRGLCRRPRLGRVGLLGGLLGRVGVLGGLLGLAGLALGVLGRWHRLGLLERDALGVERGRLLGLGEDQVVLDPPAALGDPGALADPPAQVVELRPADVAAGDDLEPLDLRRVDRKGSLDPDPERLLADRERLARAAALAADHDPLEDLGPPAGALDHLEVHADAIPGLEARDLLQLALLDALDDRAHRVKA